MTLTPKAVAYALRLYEKGYSLETLAAILETDVVTLRALINQAAQEH